MYISICTYIFVRVVHGWRPQAAAAGPRRDTAEQLLHYRRLSGAYAAVVEQARGRSARRRLPLAGISGRARFRALIEHALATASHAATASSVVRSRTCASICRARRARSAIGSSVRVRCCAAPARPARADQRVLWLHARTHLDAASAPAHLLSRTSRVVSQAKALTAAYEEVRPLAVAARQLVCVSVPAGVPWRHRFGAK